MTMNTVATSDTNTHAITTYSGEGFNPAHNCDRDAALRPPMDTRSAQGVGIYKGIWELGYDLR